MSAQKKEQTQPVESTAERYLPKPLRRRGRHRTAVRRLRLQPISRSRKPPALRRIRIRIRLRRSPVRLRSRHTQYIPIRSRQGRFTRRTRRRSQTHSMCLIHSRRRRISIRLLPFRLMPLRVRRMQRKRRRTGMRSKIFQRRRRTVRCRRFLPLREGIPVRSRQPRHRKRKADRSFFGCWRRCWKS